MATIHKVEQGECISSIAEKYGFFPKTIWDLAANAELRTLREDPNILLPGDLVRIPDKREKEVAIVTGLKHRFKRKGVPARFRLKVMNGDVPRSNIPFALLIDDELRIDGTTDGNGVLDVSIPPRARKGVLELDNGSQVIKVTFGNMDPVTESDGVRKRLFNLGLIRTMDASEADLTAAIRIFQRIQKLEPTGEVDKETEDKLIEVHDSR